MTPLKISDVKPGLVVVFIDRSLNRGECYVPSDRASIPLDGREGVVVAVSPDQPGKMVTVVLKAPHDKAHTCDGLAPDKRGVWARPEHLYTPEAHAAHKAARAETDKAFAEHDRQAAEAAEIAKKYLGE